MTVQGKKLPPPKKDKQLSEVAIRELIRPHIPEAIAKLIELMNNADNDSVKIGAVKILLSKVIPDLKSIDNNINGEIKGKWILEINKYGNNTSNKIDDKPTE